MSAQSPHIGLNPIFLVPGETGGMEIAARELVPGRRWPVCKGALEASDAFK